MFQIETKGLKERNLQEMDADMENMLYKMQLRNPRNYQVPLKKEKEPLSVKELIEQPTDLQSCSSHQDTLEDTSSEQSILDLSCKKSFVLSTSSKNDVLDAIQTNEELSTVNEENIKIRKRKYNNSPSERHYFMFTPPSESESPKKIKFEENPLNVLAMNNNIEKLSHLPINVPIPVIPTMLPTLLTANSMEEEKEKINMNIQLHSTTTTNLFSHDSPKKMPRPFKAYPLALPTNPPDLIYTENSGETYSEFRERMLVSVRRQNESSNPKMRRNNKTSSSVSPTSTVEEKDAAYWERRKKNNEAAKRSRDARRAKEDEIAIRAAFLEQENMKLKYELATLRNETAKLKCNVIPPFPSFKWNNRRVQV